MKDGYYEKLKVIMENTLSRGVESKFKINNNISYGLYFWENRKEWKLWTATSKEKIRYTNEQGQYQE